MTLDEIPQQVDTGAAKQKRQKALVGKSPLRCVLVVGGAQLAQAAAILCARKAYVRGRWQNVWVVQVAGHHGDWNFHFYWKPRRSKIGRGRWNNTFLDYDVDLMKTQKAGSSEKKNSLNRTRKNGAILKSKTSHLILATRCTLERNENVQVNKNTRQSDR